MSTIGLITVFDAILTGSQRSKELQCLYGSPMVNNFFFQKLTLMNRARKRLVMFQSSVHLSIFFRKLTRFAAIPNIKNILISKWHFKIQNQLRLKKIFKEPPFTKGADP